MTDAEKKVLAKLLSLAGESVSRHENNDFDLGELMSEVEDRKNFLKKVLKWDECDQEMVKDE